MRFPRSVILALLAGALGGCANLPQLPGMPANADGRGTENAASQGPAAYREARNAGNETLTHVASDLEAHGESETALALYRQAVTTSGGAPDANVRLGNASMRAGKTAAAIEAYRAALAKTPDDAEAELGLGSALVKNGELAKGIALLVKAAPQVKSGAAYNRLAVAQTLAGRLKEAQASLASAQALAPDDLDIDTNVALVAALAGQSQAALAATREVAASPAAAARHRRNLVIVLGLLGRDDEAAQVAAGDVPADEMRALLAQAKKIRAINDPKARAKALGMITG